MNKIKDHYRNTSKSDHLAKEDLIGLEQPIIYTISHCSQESNRKVAGKNIPLCNVAFFKDKDVKPWVINQTNAKILAGFAGTPSVSSWVNMPVELYVDSSVKMKGAVVGGIKVRTVQPKIEKDTMNEVHHHWQIGVQKVQNEGWTIEMVREHYIISEEDYRKLCDIK